jgi:hypothetical protein
MPFPGMLEIDENAIQVEINRIMFGFDGFLIIISGGLPAFAEFHK